MNECAPGKQSPPVSVPVCATPQTSVSFFLHDYLNTAVSVSCGAVTMKERRRANTDELAICLCYGI